MTEKIGSKYSDGGKLKGEERKKGEKGGESEAEESGEGRQEEDDEKQGK